jgi:hypothetical protein
MFLYEINFLTKVCAAGAGAPHSCAVRKTGSLYCWVCVFRVVCVCMCVCVCVCVEALVVSCACFGISSFDHTFFVPSNESVCISGLSMSECHTAIRCGSRGCCMIAYSDDLPCIILHVSDRTLTIYAKHFRAKTETTEQQYHSVS